MFSLESPHLEAKEIVAVLRQHKRRWLVTAGAIAALATVLAILRPDTWEAQQALFVRNEASINNVDGTAGKFRHLDDMKITQETILELAKSRPVLTAALTEVGPPAGKTASADFPNDKDLEKIRGLIKLAPPKGAEFGKTEVFYLKVRDADRQRAMALATAIANKLCAEYQQVLDEKAHSMVDEFTKTVAMAQAELQTATQSLSEVEEQVGPDLAELRILQVNPSGESDNRRNTVEIEGEIRRLTTQRRANEELSKLLDAAQHDPTHLIAAPNSLLESQPALKRLKEGLIDAQIKSAQLKGSMSDKHPQVTAAQNAEEEIRQHIHNELALAIEAVKSDHRLLDTQIVMLQSQLNESKNKLAKLASLRSEYSNLVAQVEHRTKLLQASQSNLVDAQAKEVTARSTQLIGKIYTPETGSKPLGPSRAGIVVLGIVGGLIAGAGLVLLTVPLHPTHPAHAALAEAVGAAAGSSSYGLKGAMGDPLEKMSLKEALLKSTPRAPARS